MKREGIRKDITGQKFGMLTVTGLSKKLFQTGQRYRWNCVCDCGTKRVLGSTGLLSGKTKSCGCLRSTSASGVKNHKVKAMIEKYGIWVKASDPIYNNASRIMTHARAKGVPIGFESVAEFVIYIKNISPTKCPVFDVDLVMGNGKRHDWSPSIDKIIPEEGYVRGNIQVISSLANTMKNKAKPPELIKFAMWVLRTYGYKVTKEENYAST